MECARFDNKKKIMSRRIGIIVHSQNKLLFADGVATHALGYASSQDLLGLGQFHVIFPNGHAQPHGGAQPVEKGTRVTRARHRDGSSVPVRATLFDIPWEGHSATQVFLEFIEPADEAADSHESQGSTDSATKSHNGDPRLINAINSLPAALYIFNQNGELVLWNTQAHDFFPDFVDQLRFDLPYGEMFRIAAKYIKTGEGEHADSWVKRLSADFRNPSESLEAELDDGRWIMVQDRKFTNGETISLWLDITEQKWNQEALRSQINELDNFTKEINSLNKQLSFRNSHIQDDLNMAAEFQRSILPPIMDIPFLETAHRYAPIDEVSGDVYDISYNREGALNFFIGDATGHGVAAAFLTMMVQIGLDGMRGDIPTDLVMLGLNHLLASRDRGGKFITGTFLRISPGGSLSACQAGHPPLIIIPPMAARRSCSRSLVCHWVCSCNPRSFTRKSITHFTMAIWWLLILMD